MARRTGHRARSHGTRRASVYRRRRSSPARRAATRVQRDARALRGAPRARARARDQLARSGCNCPRRRIVEHRAALQRMFRSGGGRGYSPTASTRACFATSTAIRAASAVPRGYGGEDRGQRAHSRRTYDEACVRLQIRALSWVGRGDEACVRLRMRSLSSWGWRGVVRRNPRCPLLNNRRASAKVMRGRSEAANRRGGSPKRRGSGRSCNEVVEIDAAIDGARVLHVLRARLARAGGNARCRAGSGNRPRLAAVGSRRRQSRRLAFRARVRTPP